MNDLDHDRIEKEAWIERYHRGDLDPQEEEIFEEHFFACSSCQADLEAMRSLRLGLRKTAAEEIALRGIFAWLARRGPRAQSGFVAALVLLALGPAWILTLSQKTSEPSSPDVADPFLQPRLLLLETVRGTSTNEISTTTPIQLAVDPLPGYRDYRLRVETEDGTEVYKQANISANALQVLMITLPAGFLQPGNYVLVLEGREQDVSAQEPRKMLARHMFRIIP